MESETSDFALVLIGIFKVVKALLLVAVGIGALKLLHRDVASALDQWIRSIRFDPDNRIIHAGLENAFRLTPTRLKELSVGTFVYAGLFSIEGAGLLLRKRWAEYFTIITTGALIPLEAIEAGRHFSVVKLAALVVNVLIVLYLVYRVQSSR